MIIIKIIGLISINPNALVEIIKLALKEEGGFSSVKVVCIPIQMYGDFETLIEVHSSYCGEMSMERLRIGEILGRYRSDRYFGASTQINFVHSP